MYYTTKFRFQTKPNCKANFRFSKTTRAKTTCKIHLAGRYPDFRLLFAPSFEREIPDLIYIQLLDQLRKKIWGCSQLGPQPFVVPAVC